MDNRAKKNAINFYCSKCEDLRSGSCDCPPPKKIRLCGLGSAIGGAMGVVSAVVAQVQAQAAAAQQQPPGNSDGVAVVKTSNSQSPTNGSVGGGGGTTCCCSCSCDVMGQFPFVNVTPLILAVQVRNAEIVSLLCQNGAQVNFADQKGNTALIEAVKDSPICWEVVEVLILNGAKIYWKNSHNVCASHLVPELLRFQQFCIDEFSRLACGQPKTQSMKQLTISAILHAPSFFSRGNISDKRPSMCTQTAPSVAAPSPSHFGPEESSLAGSVSTRKSIIYLHKKFRSARDPDHLRGLESCVVTPIVQISTTQGSKLSKTLSDVLPDQAFVVLTQMARNPECLMALIVALTKNLSNLITFDGVGENVSQVDRHFGKLLSQILATAVDEFSNNSFASHVKKEHIHAILSPLIAYCLHVLNKGARYFHFSALMVINKILDTGIVLELFDYGKFDVQSSMLFSHKIPVLTLENDRFRGAADDYLTVTPPESPLLIVRYSKNCPSSPGPSLPWATHEPMPAGAPRWDMNQVFQDMDPSILLTIMHNSLTMQNRVVGAKPICTPSYRWRQCNHCLQILSARLLLFLAHTDTVRKKLSHAQHLRILLDVLDPTNEPTAIACFCIIYTEQLLCYILQTVALVALNHKTHSLLIDLQVEDALVQLLLPGDDWYYTNHTTLFPQFVKHHAARILIYIGLGDRVGNRVNLFLFPGIDPESGDRERRKKSSILNEEYSLEDQYICDTCVTSLKVIKRTTGAEYLSIEGCLIKILTEVAQICTKHSTAGLDCHSFSITSTAAERQWRGVETKLVAMACLVDPAILVRILLHKLVWDTGLVRRMRVPSRKSVVQNAFHKSKSFDRRSFTAVVEKSPHRGRRTSSLRKLNEKGYEMLIKQNRIAISQNKNQNNNSGIETLEHGAIERGH
uniref:Uncharacterized protein n=1 Tax=Romanomermis culicivorax TaxID=13658 RepID=A0A915IWR9_ROMCU